MNPRWSLFAMGLLLCGCATLRPVVDERRFFLLTPQTAEHQSVPPHQLRRVEIPDYLRKRRIAWRSQGNEIRYAENLEWAEPLEKNLQQVLLQDLGEDASGGMLELTSPAPAVVIRIWQFEPDENGLLILDASWELRLGEQIRSKRVRISRCAAPLQKDASATVAAMSDAVAELSDAIAGSLKESRP